MQQTTMQAQDIPDNIDRGMQL